MRRGEVWWVTFPHTAGGEVRKDRPAVIVSNNAANQHSNRVQVVPVSSKLDKLYPCEARRHRWPAVQGDGRSDYDGKQRATFTAAQHALSR